MVFDLPVNEEKIKPHQITTLHMVCALAFIGAGTIIAVYNYTIPSWGYGILAAGISLLLATMLKNRWVLTPNNNMWIRLAEFAIAASIELYSLMQQWKFPMVIFGVLSAALLFAFFYEKTAGNKMYIHIGEDGIGLPVTSRKRFIQWHEVETVVLKFGTLSINCIDNRFFQWTTDDANIDGNAMDDFCLKMINDNIKNRSKDDW